MSTPDNNNPAIDIGRCVCGRRIVATTDPPGVGHEEPECETFLLMDVDEFVSYIRATREFSIPTERGKKQ